MQESLHLIPKSLKSKAGAVVPADFKGMSGRVVLLRVLGIPEIERTDAAATRKFVAGGGTTVGELEAFRQKERLRAMIVGVSAEHVAPADRMSARVSPVTDADLDGSAIDPSTVADGIAKGGNGRRFEDLFTAKDLPILRVWDRQHHSVSEEDLEEILGEAIPTIDP